MKALTLTTQELFGNQVRYLVPLFQRPYVWNRQDQWEPLWLDVENLCAQLIEQEKSGSRTEVPAHFLGAIVLDQSPARAGFVSVRPVVDGQQRLTTLQLLLDAAQVVVESHGHGQDSEILQTLVMNRPGVTQSSEEIFKVWPTDRDQATFSGVMDNDTEVSGNLKDEPIAVAHRFFLDQVKTWALAAGENETKSRLHTLTLALAAYLKLVVIDLEPGDNAQVIFETLNHRGAPLLAADLIKNLVFQLAAQQGLDPLPLYQKYWSELDGKQWRAKVARGRQYVPRIDIFVNYWLVMRLAKDVPSDRIFTEFRDHLVDGTVEIEAMLAELATDAATYASWDKLDLSTVPGQFRYRVLQAMDTGVVTPVVLWLLRWPVETLPIDQRDKALNALESWLVRRALCRLTSKDINRLTLDLLKELQANPIEVAGDVAEALLLNQRAESRFWPDDSAVVTALANEPLYKSQVRSRLRMVLEALEDQRRTDRCEGACPHNLTIEHIMPQAWREHWIDDSLDELGALRRDALVQTLGNLTLVNHKLNPSLSNRPWTSDEAISRELGQKGKRAILLEHSTLKINADLISKNEGGWEEADIRARTTELAEMIVQIWPRPDGAVADGSPLVQNDFDQEPHIPEPDYNALTEWLAAQNADHLPMNFVEIEDVLGVDLPAPARSFHAYWDVSNALGKAIQHGGYKATGIRLDDETVVLKAI